MHSPLFVQGRMTVTPDVDEIDTQLASDDFEPVDFVNRLLPLTESFAEVPFLITQLQTRSRRITATIREAVRSYSVLGDSSDAILADTRNSVVDLSHRIATIHSQATETATIVSRVCEGIKPLDWAKGNLSTSVTALHRLKMIVEMLNDFRANVETNNYAQCIENIRGLHSLFAFFKKYTELPNRSEIPPQIGPLALRFFDLKRQLRNQINAELQNRLFQGSADESNLPICETIDAYDDDFRLSTIFMFCEKFLLPYDDAYANSPLKEVKTRYQWFKQRLDFFNRSYNGAFPAEWRMQYHISLEFCQKTASHLEQQLNAAPPDVRVYLAAFELTLKFERKMAEVFATTETVFIGPDDPMPEFDSTPEGVRRKVEWRMHRDKGIGIPRKVPAAEFRGTIALAFAPHMSIYLNHETEELRAVVQTARARPFEDLDEIQHQLTSVSALVTRMRTGIEKCASFNLPQCLLDLFLSIKDVLGRYVQTLTDILPKSHTDPDFQLLAAIANTSALLLSIIDSLATNVASRVPEELRSTIKVEDAKEAIGNELRKQLIHTVEILVEEYEPSLIQIGTGNWTQDEGEKLPPKLVDRFRVRFSLLGTWLSVDNMNRLRSTFASRVVAIVHKAMFGQKQFVIDMGWKISSGVKELKQLVVQWTRADSTLAKKRIDTEFLQLEVEIRVLSSPDPEPMAVTYISMWPNPTREHYQSLLQLRRLSVKDPAKYMEEYDRQLTELARR
jgi:hypothetical protein